MQRKPIPPVNTFGINHPMNCGEVTTYSWEVPSLNAIGTWNLDLDKDCSIRGEAASAFRLAS